MRDNLRGHAVALYNYFVEHRPGFLHRVKYQGQNFTFCAICWLCSLRR